jgi:hypothetical protein
MYATTEERLLQYHIESIRYWPSALNLMDRRGGRGVAVRAAGCQALTSTAGAYSVRVLCPGLTNAWID